MTTTLLPPRPELPGPGRRTAARTRLTLSALVACWAATRAVMLLLLARDDSHPLGVGGIAREVHALYFHWFGVLAEGGFPLDDPLWQYPPAAGPVLLAPALLPWLSYFQAFVALAVLADAAVACALALAGRRQGRSLAGAAFWVGGLPLLLHIPLARYDLHVTALAVLALLCLARRPRTAGVLAALGALVKVWPALTLLGAPRGRGTRASWGAGIAAAGALLLVLAAAFDHAFAFLRQQGGRGVQIESLGGTALALARHAGWPGRVEYRFGAMEFTGPQVSAVAHASLFATVLGCAALLLWRVRAQRWTEATPFDAALCAVLLFTVTSRVISPQYVIWLLGLAAVCLTSRATSQRPAAFLVTAAAAVTTLGYPLLYADVMAVTWTGTLVVLVRNALLVGAVLLSWRGLWRSTVSAAAREKP
ncbi:glycosyltransferase 87 family protein [Streptomyces cavernicola]|uniref:Glycosyltransferase 87 family protein n=1 Tax=Streptomyces cavernicola TaxID=3043613 RepID=A0ABT6SJQ3_9ACTN|nr:glycosyltransferase 87 family protein [Streptomyces sp. B-S-A6]MDI3407486.1 glycosyltransferase 87 family protein [Streptomyces sp. B-S-A6]